MTLNTSPLNTSPLGNAAAVSGPATQDVFIFNGFSLQSASVVTSVMRHDSTSSRDLEMSDVARNHGRIITGDFQREKRIYFSGSLHTGTAGEMEQLIKEMKIALAKRDGTLEIVLLGTTEIRTYTATLVNGSSMFSRRMGHHITFCPFELEFTVVDPFGYEPDYTSQYVAGVTALSTIDIVPNTGSAYGRPIFLFSIDSAASITALTVTNATNGESITVTTALAAGDYLRIDSETLEVRLNGTLKNYDGVFPTLALGDNRIVYTLTGTSATFTITEKHRVAHL